MAGDWHDRKPLDTGGQDRAASRHAVGSAATRGRYDNAISRECVDVISVDIEFDVDHAHAAANDDIVDRPAVIFDSMAPVNCGVEGRALLDGVVARDQGVERALPIVSFDL